jgi:hypothetical protein
LRKVLSQKLKHEPVYPVTRSVVAYKSLKEKSVLTPEDTPSGDNVLPSLEHPVAEVFEQNLGRRSKTRKKIDQLGSAGSDRECRKLPFVTT